MHHIIVVGGGAGGLELVTRLDQAQKKVADVANEWGFWHLGQFAKGYQNWFGNFPRIHTQEATALIRAMVGGRVDARKTCRMSGSPRSTVRKERLTIREWGAIICHLVVIVTDAPTSVLQ